jgi:hypothetical protein
MNIDPRNIRYTAWSRPHRREWGFPVVQTGDWMATRDGRLVSTRTMWEGAPFAWYESEVLGTDEPASDQVIQGEVVDPIAVPQTATQAVASRVVETATAVPTVAISVATDVAVTALDLWKRYWPAILVSGVIGYAFGKRS